MGNAKRTGKQQGIAPEVTRAQEDTMIKDLTGKKFGNLTAMKPIKIGNSVKTVIINLTFAVFTHHRFSLSPEPV